MSILYVSIELGMFFIMLMMGAAFIYKGKLRPRALFFTPLIFIPWGLLVAFTGIDFSETGIFITLALEVILCRICFSDFTIFKSMWIMVVLYELTILISAVMLIVLDVEMRYNSIVEMCVVATLFFMSLLVCLTKAREIFATILDKTTIPAKVLFTFMLTASMFFIAILSIQPVGHELELKALYIRIAVVVFIFLLIITTGYIFFSSIYSNQMKSAAESFKAQIKAQSKYYQEISVRSRESRRIRHDARNMCIGLKELISQGRNEEALEMLNRRFDDLETVSPSFSTGNGIVDAILTDKQEKALACGATIVFRGSFPEEGVSPEHLCIIFGNTIDNAIEACAAIDSGNKEISVSCVPAGNYIFITITNPVLSKVRMKGGLPRTTKENKDAHGLGLFSLGITVKNCNGEMNLDCTESKFTVTIQLEVDQPVNAAARLK